MALSYETFIGRRYLRSTRGNRFVSFISLISMGGIALGVAVLIVVLSVTNGFEHELRERILSMTAHATITGLNGRLDHWGDTAKATATNPDVVAVAPYVEGQGMLVAGPFTSGVQVFGVLPDQEEHVSNIDGHMQAGSLSLLTVGSYGAVLGNELAKELHVTIGDKVVLVIPQASITIAGVTPRLRRLNVVGIFSAGMYEYDRNFAYVNLSDAAKIYRVGDGISGLRLKLQDYFSAPTVVRSIATQLGGGYLVDDWTHRNENFFRSIALAKRMLFFIMLLVVAVAAFNIVSTLVMVVKDKRADIAILRTLGTSPLSVVKVFVTQGTGIGLIGTLAGIALGTLLSINLEWLVHVLENVLGTKFMDAKIYLMSDLPAVVEIDDVVKIALTAFGLTCISTLYPAWRAARIQPAQALRHE